MEIRILVTRPGPHTLSLVESLCQGRWSCTVSWLKHASGLCWAPAVAVEFLLEEARVPVPNDAVPWFEPLPTACLCMLMAAMSLSEEWPSRAGREQNS